MSAVFGESVIFPQANGPDIELVVFGDEFYSRRETRDGYTVIYDDQQGRYCYAVLHEGRFASSGIPVSELPPAGLNPHLEESKAVQREKFTARYTQLRPPDPDFPVSPNS